MFRKSAVLKVSENFQKNLFSRVPFKQFGLSSPSPITIRKTSSTANVSCNVPRIFKNPGRASVVELPRLEQYFS